MAWLHPNGCEGQAYVELRLNALKSEKIFLEFQPLKIFDAPAWNPMWEDWHCYRSPLRIYKQDYEQPIVYFNKIYPTKEAFHGISEQSFDVCFYNWIGEVDWLKIILEIEQNLDHISDRERPFFMDFLNWLKEALKDTSIIVVEGNL